MLLGKQYDGVVLTASLFRSAFSVDVIRKHKCRFRTDIRKAEDTLFYAHILTLIKCARLSTIVPYNYRIRPQSLTTTYRRPSNLGIEKGLSILTDFRQYAEQCEGLSKTEIEEYFQYRYLKIIINYVIGLTDQRSGLCRKDINEEIEMLYSEQGPVQYINNKSLNPATFRGKIEKMVVKNRIGLITYGKLFNLIKKMR